MYFQLLFLAFSSCFRIKLLFLAFVFSFCSCLRVSAFNRLLSRRSLLVVVSSEDAQQIEEQVYEIEIQREGTHERELLCLFAAVGTHGKHVLDLLCVVGGQTDEHSNTSVTTLIVLLCIFILGGDSIRSFSFAMILGVVFGTLSSIFIASPMAYIVLGRKIKEEPAEEAAVAEVK